MASGALDAIVVGAGPNGLTAAVTLARAGLAVHVYEANDSVGGGARSEELTLPGFRHDVCSAVHPLGVGSPALAAMPLGEHGLDWVHPDVPLAHPLPDGRAAVLLRSLDETVRGLDDDGGGGRGYRRWVAPFVGRWRDLADDALQPIVRWPRHPVLLARFGMRALLPVSAPARAMRGTAAPALVAGMGAHTASPLGSPLTSATALVLAVLGHDVGWPLPRRGSQAIADALASYLRALGGEIVTEHRVDRLDELPHARAFLLDTSPRGVVALAGDRLPDRYRRRLERYRYGPAVFKVDYALSGPVPWRAEACRRAGFVHVGGTFEEIAAALAAVRRGRPSERPFVLVAQPSLFDPTRAPEGRHTLWAYAHVPNGWPGDLTNAIDAQIERFAPGFRDLVLARAVAGPPELEGRNANLVGGDIFCGASSGLQAVARPALTVVPYATPNPQVYLCSAATPPGPGVHGMCGANAARVALRRAFGIGTHGYASTERHKPARQAGAGPWTGSRRPSTG